MSSETRPPDGDVARRRKKRRPIRGLLQSNVFLTIVSYLVHGLLTFIHRTNRFVPESDDFVRKSEGMRPGIFAMWHGQQYLIPYHRPKSEPVAALVSRSTDAEINARILELNGVKTVRGSGGRPSYFRNQKGGAQALRGLIRAIRDGYNITIIADISKSTPRQASEGIVMLAKLSGRPIFPIALATSNHYVFKKTWDKTTINLPFGRGCLKIGDPVYVPRNSSEEELQEFRKILTEEMNRVTSQAYEAVGVRE